MKRFLESSRKQRRAYSAGARRMILKAERRDERYSARTECDEGYLEAISERKGSVRGLKGKYVRRVTK